MFSNGVVNKVSWLSEVIHQGGSNKKWSNFFGEVDFLTIIYPFWNLKFWSVPLHILFDLDDLYRFDMLTLFTTLLNHQDIDHVYWFLAAGLHE